MLKISSILLSFIILFQSFSFDLEDVLKIKVLADHIICHFEQGEKLSEFISQHYGSEQKEHRDKHEEHDDLPFKHQQLDTHFQVVYLISSYSLSIYNKDIDLSLKNFTYKEPTTTLIQTSIFQPPKVA